MGFLDWLPCCGSRRKDSKDTSSIAESTSLLPPPREPSILSDNIQSYGAAEPTPPGGGLTGEQRARIEEIGREVGNQMLPIHTVQSRKPSPSVFKSSNTTPYTDNGEPSQTSSQSSSRPPSPSPARTVREGDILQPESGEGGEPNETNGPKGEGGEGEGGEDGVEVTKKSLFGGGPGLGVGREGPRKVSGRGRGRGKGKGRPRGN